jgi:poly(hydroxyalkanoate) depolymerase family esterase
VFPGAKSLARWWKGAARLASRVRAAKPLAYRVAAPSGTGQWVRATYSDGAGSRAYRTYLPEKDQGQRRPLVVMLHGCKQNPEDFALGTRMNELADELGFVVVYPEQSVAANHARCWNWFRAEDQKRDAGEPALIAGITREAIARHKADRRRVYVAGLSAGGAMAAILGRTYPDLYAAVGVHSGLAYGAADDAHSALAAMRGRGGRDPGSPGAMPAGPPTIVFHGDRDTTVHPGNAERLIEQVAPVRSPFFSRPMPPTVEKGEAKGRAYTRTVRRDSAGRPAYEHWLVHDTGHAWSGGNWRGSFTDPKGPDASRAMLHFFSAATLS